MKFDLGNGEFAEIAFHFDSGNVGITMSGGTDSSILLYMLVKTIMEEKRDITIYPITCDLTRRNYSTTKVTDVIAKVKELTGFSGFGKHLVFTVPNHQFDYRTKPYDATAENKLKADMGDEYTRHFSNMYNLHTLFCGKTKNPPADIASLREGAPEDRDEPDGKVSSWPDNNMYRPFKFSDKKQIAHLYRSLGVMDSIFPLTRSCEGDDLETNYFRLTCGNCWWCRERAWGFDGA